MKLRYRPRTIWGLVGSVALVSGIVTLALSAVTIFIVHKELERQLDQRIELETHALVTYYKDNGFEALARVVRLRDQRSGTSDTGYLAGVDEAGRSTAYLLVDANGQRWAGSLTAPVPPPGWSEFLRFRRPDGTIGTAQAMNSRLADGGHLIVAADRTIINRMHIVILEVFAGGFGVLLLLNTLVMIGFGRIVRRRLTAIECSAEAIMAGDLSRRMPLDGSRSEFERLSVVLNRMLDRLSVVLENLRQISGDLAHDLRTPLQRVRGRLENIAEITGEEPVREQLETTVAEIDDVFELFSSLLAISEIEGQSIRSRFVALDLYRTVEDIVELYRPTLENTGHFVDLTGVSAPVNGDRKLLQQIVGNLLDNAALHTPAGTKIAISIERDGSRAVMRVRDDGPGIPSSQHEWVFRRLTRLDASRSTPGHGLGLNLIAAIAAAHDGHVMIEPSVSGLSMRFVFPLLEQRK